MTNFNLRNQQLPFVSIILPVFNEQLYIELCLRTLRKVSYPKEKYEIITVDNGSTDDSLHITKQYADKALFLPDGNVGAVRNFGVKHAIGEILVFLDSDCLVSSNWLHQGVELLFVGEKHVYGGNYNLREHPCWIEKFWLLNSHNNKATQYDLLGGCIFIQKCAFLDAGGFDERITSGEDSALSNTLVSLGYKVIIDCRLGVVHLGNATTVISFVKRQVWHSENYIKAIATSLKDKMFWLVILYVTSAFGLLLSIIIAPEIAVFFAIVAFCVPAILSIKRIYRVGFKPKSIVDLVSIFAIDNLYLIGRSLGILKGLAKLVPGVR